MRSSGGGTVSSIVLALAAMISVCAGQVTPAAQTTPFVFDGNRMYAELGFVRADHSIHRALAFVDMGSQVMAVRSSLYHELQLDRGRQLSFSVGDVSVDVPGSQVVNEPRAASSLGRDLAVEATLPASVLQRYQVVIDYRARTLRLAPPGTITPEGIPIPFRINKSTGLIVVDVKIDRSMYAITVDSGSAYTWVRQSVAAEWTRSHPEWRRGTGAVGAANMTMAGDGSETAGTLLRIPEILIGSLDLKQVGMFGAAPGKSLGNLELFDWYSQKNPETVIGWIGGNILKAFRLTIDYPNRMSYWLAQSPIDEHDFDQVGVTLHADGGTYFVAGIATKNGRATVTGMLPGDKVVRIGALELSSATWGQIFDALHGVPGDIRSIVVERNGVTMTITATVTAF
jgi:hypothetical protein